MSALWPGAGGAGKGLREGGKEGLGFAEHLFPAAQGIRQFTAPFQSGPATPDPTDNVYKYNLWVVVPIMGLRSIRGK